ncbi:MAG: succinate dehydrogenase, cytochrome b556 subunit [Alcaligenaceae bacterium]|nr:succinate dehydrogenase, cytochrome b556 subunit [Alcaligenaceae bacterium]
MSDSTSKPRKEYRNLDLDLISVKYRLPTAGKVSILHRISGALLFLSLPIILVPLFAASVASPESFTALGSGFGGFLLKLVLLVLLWGFMHHLCAGIRFLTLDLHLGMDKEASAKSAMIVLVVSLALTLVFAIKMFGVL